jgi:hypothetical protein
VRSYGTSDEDEGLAAGISPVPRRIIHDDMDVSDAGRHIEGIRAEHRHDPQILGAMLDDSQSVGERIRKRRIENNPRRGLNGERYNGGGTADVFGGLCYRRECAQSDCCSSNDNK